MMEEYCVSAYRQNAFSPLRLAVNPSVHTLVHYCATSHSYIWGR